MDYESAIKRDELRIHTTTWMDLKNITLREKRWKMHLLAPIQQEKARGLLLLSQKQRTFLETTLSASLWPELGHSSVHEPIPWSGGFPYSCNSQAHH